MTAIGVRSSWDTSELNRFSRFDASSKLLSMWLKVDTNWYIVSFDGGMVSMRSDRSRFKEICAANSVTVRTGFKPRWIIQ